MLITRCFRYKRVWTIQFTVNGIKQEAIGTNRNDVVALVCSGIKEPLEK